MHRMSRDLAPGPIAQSQTDMSAVAARRLFAMLTNHGTPPSDPNLLGRAAASEDSDDLDFLRRLREAGL